MRPGPLCALVLALLLGLVQPAWTDQTDPRLEELFERLRTTADAPEAREIEELIWRIWVQSEDQAVERLMSRGMEAMVLNDLPEALRSFDQVVQLAPDFAEGWNKRATVYYLLGDFKSSLADVDRTLALEPRHFGALSGLGLINLALEEYEAALRAFEQAAAINPKMSNVQGNIEETRRRIREKSI